MKYAIVLPDGAADEPLDELNGQTVLEASHKPHMDWIAAHGKQGTVTTVPEGFLPGSDVATLSLLGCDPRRYYSGRAPLEAVARDIPVGPRDIVFRCNLVTIADGKMLDFTAGHISQAEAQRLVEDLREHFKTDPVDFHIGVQYRHLMVLRDMGDLDCVCTPPHDFPDEPVAPHLPHGKDATRVKGLMDKAERFLAQHDVNAVRRDLNENPATHIWLWGQGRVTPFAPLTERFNLRAASIAAVDLIHGITKLNGFDRVNVVGATGFLDTNYAGKGGAAVEALDRYDLVLVHIEAPDEAGHMGSASEKQLAIERVDEHVVGPILEKLRTFDAWRILVSPDHPTPVSTRKHTATPPPFCLAGTDVHPIQGAGAGAPFGETHANASNLRIDPGYELMEFLLKR